jgi:hypothetical protein
MVYGGPGFWLLSLPSPPPVGKLDRKTEKDRQLGQERGRRRWERSQIKRRLKAWYSINHSTRSRIQHRNMIAL